MTADDEHAVRQIAVEDIVADRVTQFLRRFGKDLRALFDVPGLWTNQILLGDAGT